MRESRLFDVIVFFGCVSPIIICFLILDTWIIYKMDKERPPLIPITVECMSLNGSKFHTDIGISFKETGHMRYHIVEYNGKNTHFNGFCSASQVKNDF